MSIPDPDGWGVQLVPVLQTLIVGTFGYVAHLLRGIRRDIFKLREDLEKIDRAFGGHEIRSAETRERYHDRFREIERRIGALERPFGGGGVPVDYGKGGV